MPNHTEVHFSKIMIEGDDPTILLNNYFQLSTIGKMKKLTNENEKTNYILTK